MKTFYALYAAIVGGLYVAAFAEVAHQMIIITAINGYFDFLRALF